MNEIDVHPLPLTTVETPLASPTPQKVLLHTPSGILGSHSDGWGKQLSSAEGWPWTLLPVVGQANQFYLQCPLGYLGWLGQALIRANTALSERKIFEFVPAPQATAFLLRMKDPGGTYHDRYVRCKADNNVDLITDPTQATSLTLSPLQQVVLRSPAGVLGCDDAGWAKLEQQARSWSLLPITGSANQFHLHCEKGYMAGLMSSGTPYVTGAATLSTRNIFEFVSVPKEDSFFLRLVKPGDSLHGRYISTDNVSWFYLITSDQTNAARLTRTVVNVDTAIDTVIRRLAISEDELDMLLQEGPTQPSALGLPPVYLLNLGYNATIKKQKITPTPVQPRWRLVRDAQPLDEQTLQRMEMLVLLQRQMAISYRQLDELFAIALRLNGPDKILTTVALLRQWQLAGADFTSWCQWLAISTVERNEMWYRLMTMALLPSLKVDLTSFESLWSLLTPLHLRLEDIVAVYDFLIVCQQRGWRIAWVVALLTPGSSLPLLETEAYHTRIKEWKDATLPALVTQRAIQSLLSPHVNQLLKELDSSLSPIDWWALCQSTGETMDAAGLVKLTPFQLATFSLSKQVTAHATIQALIAKGSPEAKSIQALLVLDQHAIENFIKQCGEQQHNALIKFVLHDALPNEFMFVLLNWIGLSHYLIMDALLKASEPTGQATTTQSSALLTVLYELYRRIEFLKTLSLQPTLLNIIISEPTLIGMDESSLLLFGEWISLLAALDDMVRDNPAQWEAALKQGLPINTVALLLGFSSVDDVKEIMLTLGGSEVPHNLGECIHLHKVIKLSDELQIPALFLVWIFNARNGDATRSQLAASALRDAIHVSQ
ncbi:hypothetical protein RA180_20020 [Aeromonas salmonicida]|uniref:hypothetical protein n=1 Tax=Aeromonas salmonicida TaxID=645 RepID=UPI0027966C63|nr:hypothetical protein [Aeromonas salmonicida]MDQ1886283.1 hypothetical protein [Aeromonas salmonicida]